MEVTGVTGRTWTCGGNGGVIKYIADVIGNVMTILSHKQKVEIEMGQEVAEWCILLMGHLLVTNKSSCSKLGWCTMRTSWKELNHGIFFYIDF